MAFFGEKYADIRRMVTVPEVSRNCAAGRHVRNTAEIGLFHILTEGAVAAGVRRIEAVTGLPAWRCLREEAGTLHGVARELKVAAPEVPERVRKLSAQIKALEKALQEARRPIVAGPGGGDPFRCEGGRRGPAGFGRGGSDGCRRAAGSGRRGEGETLERDPAPGEPGGRTVHLVAGVTSDLTGRFSASDIVRKAAAMVGGGGGGRKDMAQAGGSRVGNLPEALASDLYLGLSAPPGCYPGGFSGRWCFRYTWTILLSGSL